MPTRHRVLPWVLGLFAAAPCAQIVELHGLTTITAGGTAPHAHSCALDANGAAFCWGSNDSGQLGDGSFARRTLATRLAGQTEAFASISAGSAHTCALGVSGAVHCWGDNSSRQLGVTTTGRSATPIAVPLPGAARSISTSGGGHGCAVLASGAVACWGANSLGQLGGGDAQTRFVDRVDLPMEATLVATGVAHSCAILSSGSVYCWGQNNAGQTGQPSSTASVPRPVPVAGISGALSLGLGDFGSCAITGPGAVHCWGSYTTTIAASATPVVVAGLQSGATKVALGGYGHLCASLASGGLRCLGLNFLGQLGRGAVSLTEGAGAVVGISERITSFDAGYFHTCAVVAGQARCWGEGTYGQLGRNDDALATAPGRVLGLVRPALFVDGGGDHGCAVDNLRRVHCWGSNSQGQLGDGTLGTRAEAAPISAPDSTSFAAVALGSAHSCALDTAGSVKCWGAGSFGQLGNGANSDSAQPVTVDSPDRISQLSVGLFHACAVVGTGTARCWGYNATGELGDGSTQHRSRPVDVQGLPGAVTAVAAAFGHSCALLPNGAVWCWGGNFSGQLGRQTSTSAALPPGPVDGLSGGVSQIVVGYALSCALMSADRSVRCWGSGYGPAPRAVDGLASGVRSIAADGGNRISGPQQQLCALLDDGVVRCSGSNRFGQLGDGTTLARARAEVVGGVRAAVAIGVGEHHACAVGDDGGVECWGGNAIGQLGQGSFGLAAAPVAVVTDRSLSQIEPASEGANGASRNPAMDALGRYLVFESSADNLAPGDTNAARDVFRRDRATDLTQLVSVDDAERPIAGDSIEPSISADGELIVFVAPDAAVMKTAGESQQAVERRRKGGQFAIFLRNMVTGTTQRIASALPGGAGTTPNISPLARAIAFTGLPLTPEQGTPGQPNVFVVPLRREGDHYFPGTPACPTCRMSLMKTSNGPSREGVLSADAEWLAFTSQATNLPGVPVLCPQASSHVYLRNLITGQLQNASSPASASQCGTLGASQPSIDWSGQRIAFESGLPLAEDDRNGFTDVYLFDATSDTHERVSEDPRTGHDGLDASTRARISGDGNVVAFQSSARNLESSEADDNETGDIFVRHVQSDAMRRVSRNARGDQGNERSEGAALDWNGASIAFATLASNLSLSQRLGQPTDNNGVQDVFRVANPLVAANKSGTWWIPAESGWGLFTVDQGNALGVGWFTYDSDGEPTWFVGAAFAQADGRYVGEMFRTTGVPLADISGRATETSVKFADVTLRFGGSGELQFDYAVVGGPSQGKRMSRFVYAGADILCHPSPSASRRQAPNASDLWWGGADTSGWGIFVNQAHDLLVSSWYTYDTDREAIFLTAVATRQPDGKFVGQIHRQANGTPYDRIDNAPPSVSSNVVGTLSVDLLDGETADFAYTLGSTVQSRRISRYTFGSRPATCAEARP